MSTNANGEESHLDVTLLECLAKGSTTAELREYGRNHPSPQNQKLVAAAVSVRSRIEELEDRERALVRLSESVRDIAGLDGVDGVLQSIVSRSRRLLMADVAYFLSYDEATQIASMHVSEGIISDAFSSLTIDPGEGISGYIATTRRPSWASNYLTDARYIHTATIDSATAEEGLLAIVGVPVMWAGRVVGLLLAGDRHAHAYRPQDVELLFSLAQHAGVLIENATVHARGQKALEQLESALHALEADERTSQAILELQDRLVALLMNRGSLDDLASMTQSAVGGTIVICDDGRRELARAGLDNHAATDDGWNSQPLPSATSTLGYMLHRTTETDHDERDDTQSRQILVRAVSVGALMLESLQASLSTSREAATNLINELVHDPLSDRAAMLRGTVSIDIESLDTVLLAMPHDISRRFDLFRAAHRLAEQHHGMSCESEAGVLLWLPGGHPNHAAQQAAASLSSAVNNPVTVGASRMAATPESLGEAVAEAKNTVSALTALGRIGQGADSSGVAPFPTILAKSSSEDIDLFVRDVLGQLLDHDAEHQSALLPTLEAVYRNSSNVVAAAESLYLHANTVHQRLAKIDQITGVSWRDTDIALQRQLALRVNALKAPHPLPAKG